jgi:hypothetical protein
MHEMKLCFKSYQSGASNKYENFEVRAVSGFSALSVSGTYTLSQSKYVGNVMCCVVCIV